MSFAREGGERREGQEQTTGSKMFQWSAIAWRRTSFKGRHAHKERRGMTGSGKGKGVRRGSTMSLKEQGKERGMVAIVAMAFMAIGSAGGLDRKQRKRGVTSRELKEGGVAPGLTEP
jgi:hypothetical protein